MSLISRLHRNPLHNTAHYHPYMARYHEEGFTVLDHYRHLRQILFIYQALEIKLQDPAFSPKLPDDLDLSFALNRSAAIQNDLAFLKPLIPLVYQNEILPATREYAEQIRSIDVSTNEGRNQLFSHFLIRILGDLFGGQGLKSCAITAYQKAGIYQDKDPVPGTEQYHFRPGALKDFSSWLNRLELNDEQENDIVRHADDAYQKHINLFSDLESTRPASAVPKPFTAKTSVAQNTSSFFSCNTLTKAAAVGALALSTGLVITAAITRLT
ncbi:Heme oxygenase [Aquicella siphonis]|uniref:Heme oxygenase n=1 Tax=Aquicella siphonis TaxID=254247 RepID=A0A5E4PEC1_9COXI|nr:biliverdin-producing heme oxygenase [Aquicella siphonis]VVC74922.1 Heme oxygenase [Aquicella siphonis]